MHMTEGMKPSISQGILALLDMVLKLPPLYLQGFGVAFLKSTKNAIL